MRIEDAIKQVKPFSSMTQKAVVNILYTASWVQQKQASVFKPHSLSMQQYNVLRILRGQHPEAASVKLLAERMIDKSSNVSRLIEKLRAKNLIEREASKFDRRQVDIRITETGLSTLENVDKELKAIEFSGLSQEELNDLSDLLDQFRTQD